MVCRAETQCHWACYEFGSAHIWVRASLYLLSLSLCVLHSLFGRAHAAPGLVCNHSLRRTAVAVYGLSACWIPKFAMHASQLWFGLGGKAGSTARLSSEALCHRPPTLPSKPRSSTTLQFSSRQCFVSRFAFLFVLISDSTIWYSFKHCYASCKCLTLT
jgi:hypothetical protein